MRPSLSGLFTTITLLAVAILGFAPSASASDAGLEKTGTETLVLSGTGSVTGSGTVNLGGTVTWSGGTAVLNNGGVLVLDNGGWVSLGTGNSALRHAADFETYPVGAGKLFAPGVVFPTWFQGAVTGTGVSGLISSDPLQGIVASSPLGSGQAAYLGGAGTKLTLPKAATPFAVSLRQTRPNEAAVDLLRRELTMGFALFAGLAQQTTPIMQVGFDFVVSRAGTGANQQAFTVSLRDERDASDATTLALHSRVRIQANNTVAIADHGDVFAPTDVTVVPGVGYRLIVTTDYTFAVWSAVLERRDTGARSVLAGRRPLNTDGFQLSPWVLPGTFDLTMTAVASATNKAFADRLTFDQVRGATIERPLSPVVHAFENLHAGAGGLLTAWGSQIVLVGPGGVPIPNFSGYSGYATHAVGDPADDPIQGIVESSPLGTGRAFYLGGAGTNLALPVYLTPPADGVLHLGGTNFVQNTDPTTFSVSVFPGKASDLALNAAGSAHPHRRLEADFYLQREEGATNAQTLTISVVDARDESDAATSALHSRIRIDADNAVAISDLGDDFIDTGAVLASATAYRLELAVDYSAATWSASIRSRDGSAAHTLAEARPLNTEDFTLSGWVRRGLIEIEHGAEAFAADMALPDRFYLDNLVVFDSPATLDAYKPFFVVAPANVSVLPGVSHVFRAEAYGEPAPAYQWFRNDDPISGATAATLTVPGADYGVNDDISVAATNDSGTTVRIADFTVLPPLTAPEITDQPASLVIVSPKDTVTLSATAKGNPAPSWQWRRNGKAIRGAQGYSFTFVASTSTVGTYDFVVTNSQGSDTSTAIMVALTSAPKIITGLRAQTVDEGAPVTFTVAANCMPAPSSYTWKKGTEIVAETTASSFTIPAVSRADAGKYSVVVSNGVGKPATSAAATLAVRFAPEITVDPVGVETLAGRVATLRVTAVGNPAPKYQWRLNGEPIPGEAARRAAYPFTATLARAGSYDVVVSNALGSTTSEPATVVVNQAPKVGAAPAAARLKLGASHTLSVAATGYPAPTYQWFKDGEPLAGATGSSLAFASLKLDDAGAYSVRVQNSFGVVTTKVAALDVSVAPYSLSTRSVINLTGDGYFIDGEYIDLTHRLKFSGGKMSDGDETIPYTYSRQSPTQATIRGTTKIEGVTVRLIYVLYFSTTGGGACTVAFRADGYGEVMSGSGTFTYSD